jgi:phosphoglycolate phosphatase-like HAD superfamily hydrolase
MKSGGPGPEKPPGGCGPAVVFDYDGTLIDSRRVKVQSYRRAVEIVFSPPEGSGGDIEASCLRTMGASRFLQLEDTLRVLKLSATRRQRERWSRVYSSLNREALPRVSEFPSARRLLRRLKEAGYAIFAASGILEKEFLVELAGRGLSAFFLEASGADKAGFLRALKVRGYEPILFVGDTRYDRETAAREGVSFFRIDTDRDIRRLERELLPD